MARQRQRKPRQWRLTRHLRHVSMIWHDPRSSKQLVRAGLLGIWRSRGGGFYGLGYLITFVALEVRLVTGEFQTSDSLLSFFTTQLVEFLLRLGFMSFVNVLLAFLWPLFVLQHLHGWGVLVLVAGYFLFARWLRPAIVAAFPELRPAASAEVEVASAGAPPPREPAAGAAQDAAGEPDDGRDVPGGPRNVRG